MARPLIYLDTSVPSAYFDDRAPDRQRLTQEFWRNRLPAFEPRISQLVRQEIQVIPEHARRSNVERLVAPFEDLLPDADVDRLAQEYLSRGIFTERHLVDAVHVALAVSHGLGYVVSWNYRHLVRVATRREVNLVNALLGFGPLEIVAPPEL